MSLMRAPSSSEKNKVSVCWKQKTKFWRLKNSGYSRQFRGRQSQRDKKFTRSATPLRRVWNRNELNSFRARFWSYRVDARLPEKQQVAANLLEKTVVNSRCSKTVRDNTAAKASPERSARNETLMQLVLELATVKDVDTLVAFERKVADRKIYGQPRDFQGALEEINRNTLYLIRMGELLLGTAAYSLRQTGAFM
jgi:hypothetical protein